MNDSCSTHHIYTVGNTKASAPFILVVDDEPANLSLLKEALSATGLKIRVVTSGLKAIEIARKHPPRLILLDVAMPEIDGFETCQRLKADVQTANIPIIFATAFSELDQKIQAFSLGAVDYITKPFHVEEVLARVKVQLALQALNTNLQEKNQALEREVQARGLAEKNLTESNHKLQHSLQALQKAQVQLIQSKKMSSLGQMMAGIAHEINNPINFIYGNIQYLRQPILDIFRLIDQYTIDYPEETKTIANLKNELDLNFLKTDIPKVLTSIHDGVNRIQDILTSLRIFSHLNEAERKKTSIEKGIDSVLLILGNHIQEQHNRPAIRIIKQYSNLPLIYCYPGTLNQVFWHIIINAIDALEEQIDHAIQTPAITIKTALEKESVSIKISDNGSGIPENVQEKIFDPFFSTKSVGNGKGLGLAISHQIIVEQHGGTLKVESNTGQGLTFTILLPLRKNISSELE
ncbi:MAG: response regulator [Cyanobacteria bacterium P01_F01_bin.150]